MLAVSRRASVALPERRSSRPTFLSPPDQTCRLSVSAEGRPVSKRGLDIASLTLDERLRLLEQLWDSLAAKPEGIPLTDAQRAELDRRLDELEAEGPVGIPWDEVLSRIRSRSR